MCLKYVRYPVGNPSGDTHPLTPKKEVSMPVSRTRQSAEKDAAWYAEERHANQRRNERLFLEDGWYYCDTYSFYRSLFPEGFLQPEGGQEDGKPNVIVIEDTGRDVPIPGKTDRDGKPAVKRVMHRYTIHDDLEQMEELRNKSVIENTFMFLSPVSYYGKSRDHRNARYLHAFMIDLDYVGDIQLENLLHQMKRGVIPFANFLVSSGTGLHVVYLLKDPIPLMTRYVAGLQAIKSALTERVWNAHTSRSDPDKKQRQGIFQGFRMVGSATKLNGEIGNPKIKQPYVVTAFSHDSTPPATISYLLSFIPQLKSMTGMDDLAAAGELAKLARRRTPIAKAKELWPEWYENTVVQKKPRGGWTYGRAGYDDCLKAIREQASVSHRYWCIFYLAVMANKCGVSWEELEDDAYGLLKQFDDLSIDPSNRFTAHDVAAALEAYEDGAASGRARRYTKAFCERHSAVTWEKRGTVVNPPEKRLPPAETLEKARSIRDLHQKVNGTNWWDNGNRDGAPKKAMLVWQTAIDHPEANHSQLARIAGVSRPTVIKWLKPGWRYEYMAATAEETEEATAMAEKQLARQRALKYEFRTPRVIEEQARRFQRLYENDRDGWEKRVVQHVATHPWKSFDEVAVFMGLKDGNEVSRIIDKRRDYYDRLLMGVIGSALPRLSAKALRTAEEID